MSPVMAAVMDRTEAWAWVSEQGAAAVQAVPLPVGETYRVAAVAAWDSAGMPKAAATSVAAAARIDGRARPPRRRVPRITVLPLAGAGVSELIGDVIGEVIGDLFCERDVSDFGTS
jgi:Na+/glutamate symporter